jgi:hypothetical protein
MTLTTTSVAQGEADMLDAKRYENAPSSGKADHVLFVHPGSGCRAVGIKVVDVAETPGIAGSPQVGLAVRGSPMPDPKCT